jgi:hypothetical protein
MSWQGWLDIPIIRAGIRHASGTIVSSVLSWVTAWTVKQFLPEYLARRVESIEGIVLVTLFVILAIQLGLVLIKELWKQLKGGWNGGAQVLAV